MNRVTISLSIFAVSLLLVACGRSGAHNDGDQDESSSAENSVAPEAPAPLQSAGQVLTYNFDSDVVGKLPAKSREALTGGGGRVQYEVDYTRAR